MFQQLHFLRFVVFQSVYFKITRDHSKRRKIVVCILIRCNFILLLLLSNILLKPDDGEILIEKTGTVIYVIVRNQAMNTTMFQSVPFFFMKSHNVVKFFELLSTKKQSLLRKLGIFIKHINKVFCTPGLPTVVP